MPQDTRYLRKRASRPYEVALAVPRDLRDRLGCDRLVKSLSTHSLREAQRLRWAPLAEWQEMIDRARSRKPLDDLEIEAEASRFYDETLKAALGYDDHGLEITLDAFAEGLTHDDGTAVEDRIAAVIRKGIDLDHGAENRLTQALLRAGYAACHAAASYRAGEAVEAPEGPWNTALSLPGAKRRGVPQRRRKGEDGSPRLSEVVDRYFADRSRDPNTALSGKHTSQVRATARFLGEFTGDAPIGAINRADCAEFLEAIASLDPGYGRRAGDAELSFGELRERYPGALTNKTINRHASAMRALWVWAEKAGLVADDRNPWDRLTRPKAKVSRTGWLAFEPSEIGAIWQHLMDTSPEWRRPAKRGHSVRTALPWAFAMGLYAGLRVEEICSLRIEDVRLIDGIWAFDISEEGGRRVKTANAERQVPVHPALIDLGLLEYRKHVEAQEINGQLFPGLKRSGADGTLSPALVKAFARVKEAAGVTRDRVVFHSTRKVTNTLLERAQVHASLVETIMGHAKAWTFQAYSQGVTLEALKEAMEKITIPEIWQNPTAHEAPLAAGA